MLGKSLSTDIKVANGKAVYGTPQSKSGFKPDLSQISSIILAISAINLGKATITLKSK